MGVSIRVTRLDPVRISLRNRERETEKEKQRRRNREGERETEKHRKRKRNSEIETNKDRERQIPRGTERDRDRERQRQIESETARETDGWALDPGPNHSIYMPPTRGKEEDGCGPGLSHDQHTFTWDKESPHSANTRQSYFTVLATYTLINEPFLKRFSKCWTADLNKFLLQIK